MLHGFNEEERLRHRAAHAELPLQFVAALPLICIYQDEAQINSQWSQQLLILQLAAAAQCQ